MKFNKPTVLNIAVGMIVYFFKDKTVATHIPESVGKYRLVSEMKKTDERYASFTSGVYADMDDKVFIKTWSGNVKDSDYYSLVNEYRIGSLLHKKLVESEFKETIRVPKILSAIEKQGSLSVVFEYIEGVSLQNATTDEQTDVLHKCHSVLAKISKTLTKDEARLLMKRTPSFYILTSPFLTTLLALTHPRFALRICTSFFKSMPAIFGLLQKELVITHRDLIPQNILTKNGVVYIVDLERTVLTFSSYDPLNLYLEPGLQELKEVFRRQYAFNANLFLKNYMLMHFALSSGDIPSLQTYYLSLL